MPEPFELCPIRPMEGAVPFELRIMELAFKPASVRKNLLPFPFDAVMLELAFVPTAVRPR
jgi:hypothetical protein